MWTLKSILLKDEKVNQEIRELKRLMETNENEVTTVQNLWDTAKAVLRGKYIAIQASLKKLEKKKSNTQANLAPKGTGERIANKTYTKQKRVNKDSSRTQ